MSPSPAPSAGLTASPNLCSALSNLASVPSTNCSSAPNQYSAAPNLCSADRNKCSVAPGWTCVVPCPTSFGLIASCLAIPGLSPILAGLSPVLVGLSSVVVGPCRVVVGLSPVFLFLYFLNTCYSYAAPLGGPFRATQKPGWIQG
ncbi:hypothetical protein BGX38DRAFT_651604 [Terfezia claveryi]|nr:hypothetical protein BGX38DRAFT_651604 [Terfezia claveryi]